MRDDLHAGEQQVQVGGDDVLEGDVAAVARRHPAVDDRRDLDAREVLLAGLGVAQHQGEVQREARDVGEGVGRVDRQRREHREDPVAVGGADVGALARGQVVPADEGDARLGERRHDVGREGACLLDHEAVTGLEAAGEHVLGVEPAGRGHGHAGGDAALEAGDAHHEELVEVAGEDRQEAHALEQGQRGVVGELEHPGVERDPRQLAVEEAVRGQLTVGRVERRVDVELVG